MITRHLLTPGRPARVRTARSTVPHAGRFVAARWLARLAALVAAVGAAPCVTAQTSPGVTAGASYERQRDRYAYRFENPSTFDTPLLVPHFFEQTYVADNHWILGHVGYGGRRLRGRTQVGLTPAITTRGDDVDTFIQPGGDIVTSGTTGDVTLRSWRVDQRVDLTASARVRWYTAYGYRRDAARFHEGLKSVTHTQPASAQRSIVTTRETTTSDVHEIRIGADLIGPPMARRWRYVVNVEATPGCGDRRALPPTPQRAAGVASGARHAEPRRRAQLVVAGGR